MNDMSMGCTVMALAFSTVLARRSICSMEGQQDWAAMARILAALFWSVCCRGKHSWLLPRSRAGQQL